MFELDAMNSGLLIGMIFGFLGGFAAAMAALEGRAILNTPVAPPARKGKRNALSQGNRRG